MVAAVWAGIALAFPSYTHRYRLTLEVEADGEILTGSGVIEVSWQKQPKILPQVLEWTESVRGQTVPVDLGRHGLLLAVLAGAGPRELWGAAAPYLAMRAFAGKVPGLQPLLPSWRGPGLGMYPPREGAAIVAWLPDGSRAALDADSMPQLVWLPDPNDRSTARPVPPSELSSAIAPGVRLRGMAVEITRDRVTTGLGKRLPWLGEFVRTTRSGLQIFEPAKYQMTWDTLSQGIEP
jgi:hypothetical protein